VSRRARPTAVSVSELVQMLNTLQSRGGGYAENSGGGGGGSSSSSRSGSSGIYPPLQSLRFGR